MGDVAQPKIAELIAKSALLRGEFITRAGAKTDYYIDKYRFETDPAILQAIATEMARRFPDPAMYDRIAAPELGAVALAVAISLIVKKPFVIVRKSVKGYGTKTPIEGPINPTDRLMVVEDVLTTGGAVLDAIDHLCSHGNPIVGIVAVVDRQSGAIERIQQAGISVSALVTTADIFAAETLSRT